MDYVKVNKVKDRINELDKHLSKDSQEKLNKIVDDVIVKAVDRCEQNKRNTVLSRDF